jgi:RNA polymerase-binding protein DksA
MSVLNNDQTLEFKTRLRERADRLRSEIRGTLDRSNGETHAAVAEPVHDSEDDSFSNLIVDVNLSEVDRDAEELRRIDSALTRLADGSYGLCVDCDRAIPVARLEAEPTALRCVQCQELFEKTHATQNTPTL